MAETIDIPLTPVDHAPSRQYCAFLFYIPLKPGIKPRQAFGILQEGLHRTFVQLPWLSGRIWRQSPDAPGYRPGQLVLRHGPVAPDGEWPSQLRFNELDSSVSFDELRDAAFPTNSFPDDSLRWIGFRPDVNEGPDVFMAQANFIPGGCILAAGPHHLASDGAAAITIATLWADHCRELQSNSPVPVLAPASETYDRTFLDRTWAAHGQRESGEGVDPSNWRLLGRPGPPEPVPEPTNEEEQPSAGRSMKSSIFYVPAAKFSALHKACAQAGEGITATDALVALLWRSNVRARRKIALQANTPTGDISDPQAWAGLAAMVDGRAYFKPEWLPPDYLGNLTCINLALRPIAELVSPELSLGDVARSIREGANTVTVQSLMDAYALARDVPDYDRLAYSDLRLDSAGLLISPLVGLPVRGMNFGSIFGNGGCPEAMRPPMAALNRTTRTCFMLPRLEGGGVEVLLNMFEEEMEVLMQDKEFTEYAMFLAD
ncbi:uncharacterized protein DNG_07106 [Cephalotrichum gorgonifer]|uniref:Transferase domain-containing protein n=1 Tax=Cephalotrichum gorgonifer TaxID=2041049 RepID=A0AAE8N121_9PEZI|nr:uncharacterized protein DNG_07106 [Cephalotrichum gorgonifer]